MVTNPLFAFHHFVIAANLGHSMHYYTQIGRSLRQKSRLLVTASLREQVMSFLQVHLLSSLEKHTSLRDDADRFFLTANPPYRIVQAIHLKNEEVI